MAASPQASEAPAGRGLAVVLMGVCGSGKSTVAAALAGRLGLCCIDGDDLHAPENVAKMRSGVPLTDADRWPWLDRIGAELARPAPRSAGTVVSCSALRRAYRERLRAACPDARFVFLHGDVALLEARLRARSGHYMPAALLASQLDTLEAPAGDETDVLALDIADTPERLARAAADWLLAPEGTTR